MIPIAIDVEHLENTEPLLVLFCHLSVVFNQYSKLLQAFFKKLQDRCHYFWYALSITLTI